MVYTGLSSEQSLSQVATDSTMTETSYSLTLTPPPKQVMFITAGI